MRFSRRRIASSTLRNPGLEHLVPLSHQAVSVISAARLLTGRGPLVFPNARHAHRPMSENAIGYLLIGLAIIAVTSPTGGERLSQRS